MRIVRITQLIWLSVSVDCRLHGLTIICILDSLSSNGSFSFKVNARLFSNIKRTL